VPLESVIDFKREAYRLGLEQLASFLEVTPRTVGLSPYGRRRKRPRGVRPAAHELGAPLAPLAGTDA
jgi:hypothetical protein